MNTSVAPAPHLRRLGFAITIASVGAIALATLLPQVPAEHESILCLACGPLDGLNAILNVLLFVPLGVGLALGGVRWNRAVLGMCAFSALIEIAQFFVIPGRNASIGDVITNSLGGALGFAIARFAFTLLRPSPRIALTLTSCWSLAWLSIQAFSAFGLTPAFPSSRYYGEIAPELGGFEQYRGSVLRAGIADVTVHSITFQDSRRVRELLLRGEPVTTTIVPAGPVSGIAPIVRVADDSQREIAVLAQSAHDLVFGVRTGADVLLLRSPYFLLANVFPSFSVQNKGALTDTLRVSARYSAREASVTTQTVRSTHVRRIPIAASLGWTMVMPHQWFIEGTNTELVLSAIWVACLVLPLGYWGFGITPGSEGRDTTKIRMAALPIALVLLYVGLVVVPRMYGVSAAPLSDWFAALSGVILGAALRLACRLRMGNWLPSD